ncbi:MotA/TolQ/ExbB proton channel family protein [Anaerobiospirillum sp. NML120448]|uniref:MotA/TolQ/ExbB proton channel family protein n=1 Tax=Anaerobiospirillum sp. NML120448 TaxID=2932816 RepID=UPI001FF1E5C1|nr:MotA/TolQ/ExbB proton channel family protein [Anaerobiospirillum sp. NML120448]MCK0513349.1 MotA/TolQ/ExbB proton channel family protein [Anaerobiospirillum sp. NML120448]
MAIRGTVLVILVKRQSRSEQSITQDIINTVKSNEQKVEQNAPGSDTCPSRELIINTLMQVQLKGIYSSMYFLKLCAAVGPLLGLLGTVLGMVDVFSTLSERSMPDPSMLAGGIWEALLTTVMGLTLAIPALIVHYYLLMSLRGLRNQINLAISNIHIPK